MDLKLATPQMRQNCHSPTGQGEFSECAAYRSSCWISRLASRADARTKHRRLRCGELQGLEAEMCALLVDGRPQHVIKTTTRASMSTLQASAAKQKTGPESPCGGPALTLFNHKKDWVLEPYPGYRTSPEATALTDFELLQPALEGACTLMWVNFERGTLASNMSAMTNTP